MSYFGGLDVSLRTVALWVVDADRDIVLERMLDCEVEAIDVCLRKFGKPITKLGFEAGVMSLYSRSNLQSLQLPTPPDLKEHASKIRATSSSRIEYRNGVSFRLKDD